MTVIDSDQSAEEELEQLALEGLNSGDPIAIDPDYWEVKHRRHDERGLKTHVP